MGKKILVVDNHPLILKFMSTLLSKRGHTVLTAGDGLKALQILKKVKPDIIFIDLVMPFISGNKLCSIIRDMPGFEDVRIIILSAVAETEARDYKQIGANARIVKGPFGEMSARVLAEIEETDGTDRKMGVTGEMRAGGPPGQEIMDELLLSKKHLELILDNLSEGIVELVPEAVVVYANRAAVNLLGISETSFLASSFLDIFHGEERNKIQRLLSSGSATTSPEKMIIKHNDLLISIQAIHVAEGEQASMLIILDDITKEQRLEEERTKVKKLDSFSDIARGIAHDFNNLLTVILGNINLARIQASIDQKTAALQEAEKASLQARDLTQMFLSFSGDDEPNRKPTSVRDLLEYCSRRKEIPSNIECAWSLPDGLWMIDVDGEMMRQALFNVVKNAEEAMPGGGTVEITAKNRARREVEQETGLTVDAPRYVKISIRDHGTGITEENIGRIFDPYFSTKDRYTQKGLGLGLAITHSIIQKHGGYVHVESTVGKGTVFFIYLPAWPDA